MDVSNSPTDVIVIAGVVVTGSTMVRRYSQKKKGEMQTLTYGVLMIFVLLVMAIPLPAFAKGLAYLSMIGAFVVNGPELVKITGQWQ